MNYLRGFAFREIEYVTLIEKVDDKAWRQKLEYPKKYLHMFIKQKTDSHNRIEPANWAG